MVYNACMCGNRQLKTGESGAESGNSQQENRTPSSIHNMPFTITSSRLSTCNVIDEGRAIRLDFVDQEGRPLSVEFPFEQAHAIIMTLPQMLAQALKRLTLDQAARYVFPLGRWSIESGDNQSLITTLATKDGFQVSFAIPFDACKAIGWALKNEGQMGLEEQDGRAPRAPTSFN
jgi:hypothetical protein